MLTGELLKEFRTSLGLSQNAFAKTINTSTSNIYFAENSKRKVGKNLLLRIMDTYKNNKDFWKICGI